MPARLYILVLILNIVDGFIYNNILTHGGITFPEKLEKFLNSKNHNISSHCKDHLLFFAKDLKLEKEWAMNMYDAGAKTLPPGIMNGNLVDLGNFEECLNIHERKNNTQVFGKYCIGNTFINSNKFQTKSTLISGNSLYTAPSINGTISVYLARCFPEACSTIEMQNVYASIDFELSFSTNLCQTKATQFRFDTAAYITVCVVVFMNCVVHRATYLDYISLGSKKERPNPMITAFSLLENGRQILDTSRSATDISCVHGIRVLSCMWIMLFHRHVAMTLVPISNFFYYRDWFKQPINMLMHSAPIAVDTFFLLSGLFVAYNYMMNASKGIKFNLVSFYAHRYLRLTPILAMHIAILKVGKHFGSGPIWSDIIGSHAIDCEISWWRTLLYIQNIYVDGMPTCFPHTWYLSTDMQLFILSPLLLIILKKWPKRAFFLIGFLTSCSMITSFSIGWIYQVNPIFSANEIMNEFLWNYYYPVYTRASPWLIGLVLGYFLATLKERRLNALKCKKTVYGLWICTVIVLLACVFSGHGLIANEHRRILSALHMALVRPIWAVAMSWVIFSCANGYGGFFNLFLSLPMFQILSKLTYIMYLAHPLFIIVEISQLKTPPVFSTFDMLYKFWGDFALTFCGALLGLIGIEMPVMAIYKYLTSSKKKEN